MAFKVKIGFKKPDGEVDHQDKTFKDEMDALTFCRKHWEKIDSINYMPFMKLDIFANEERCPTHYEIMDLLLDK